MSKLKWYLLILLTTLSIYSSGQEKLVDFGIGFEPNSKSKLFSFNFAFNRTESGESKPGPYLWTKKNIFFSDNTDVLSLKPSAEASFGNVESSPNNFVLEGGFDYSKSLGKTTRLLGELAPAFSSNRTLDTTLWYANLGIKFLHHNYPSKVPFLLLPYCNIQWGKRIEGGSSYFTRIVPGIQFTVEFFEQKMTFTNNLKCYFINGDSQIPNGSYPYICSEIGYRLNSSLKFLVKYVNGQEQPTFQRMYAITFGLAIYNK